MMFLSIRFLLARKKQSFLILLGITIGTAAYVGISGMMMGFQTFMLDQLVNNEAHVRISAREQILTKENLQAFNEAKHVFWIIPPSGLKGGARLKYPLGWFNRLDKDVDVVAYSPQALTQVIFQRGKITLAGRMIGSRPELQANVTNIEKYMTKGHFKDIGSSGNKIIVGEGLLERLGGRVSETILISSGSRTESFKIVATFKTGIKPIDEGTIFASLSDAQKLRGAPSEITDIAIKLADPEDAQAKAGIWKVATEDKVLPWQESSASILSVFKTQDIVRNSMTIAIIIVAGFGIYNILSILVAQKRRDIAILRSMGYSPRDIVSLFFNQGIILGVLGSIVGLIIGFILCKIMGSIEVTPGRMSGPGTTMIISYDPLIYIKALLLALTSAILSSILPARAGGKLEPMQIFRSGGE
jgi:lipoprotein-releasing system permease protein